MVQSDCDLSHYFRFDSNNILKSEKYNGTHSSQNLKEKMLEKKLFCRNKLMCFELFYKCFKS